MIFFDSAQKIVFNKQAIPQTTPLYVNDCISPRRDFYKFISKANIYTGFCIGKQYFRARNGFVHETPQVLPVNNPQHTGTRRTESAQPRHCGLDPQPPVQLPVIVAQRLPTSPNILAKAPVVCGDHHTHRLKPGAIQRHTPVTAQTLIRVQNPVRVTRGCDAPPSPPPDPLQPPSPSGLPPQGEEKGQTFFRGEGIGEPRCVGMRAVIL
jgi:hypothetical protein